MVIDRVRSPPRVIRSPIPRVDDANKAANLNNNNSFILFIPTYFYEYIFYDLHLKTCLEPTPHLSQIKINLPYYSLAIGIYSLASIGFSYCKTYIFDPICNE